MSSFIRIPRIPAAAVAAALIVACGCAKEPAAGDNGAAPAAATAAPETAAAPVAATNGQDAGAPSAAPQAPEPVLADSEIPEIVARVEGEEITRADLLARAGEARGALAQRGVPPPPSTRTFYRKVLDDLIGNALVFRQQKAAGKEAPAADVAAQMAALRSQFESDADFDKALAERGFDRPRLEREIAESLTVQKWVAESILPTLQVTEAEAREFYTANQERMINPERVRARHILLTVDPEGTAEQKQAARTKLEELRAKLAGGADFATVARESSQDPGSAPRGGELGWIVRGQTVPAFEAAAFAAEVGKLSEVVETRFGFHLLEVQEKVAQSTVPFEQARPRIEELLKQRKMEQVVGEKLNELGSKAKVEILL